MSVLPSTIQAPASPGSSDLQAQLAAGEKRAMSKVSPTLRRAHQSILACKRDMRWKDACGILRNVHTDGRRPLAESCNAAIDLCGKAKQLEHAMSLFDFMLEVGNVPDAITYTTLIDACGRLGRVDDALELFKRMGEARVVPNQITYNALLHACHRAGAVDQAFTVWQQLRGDGTQAGVRTFTELIGACCKARPQAPRAPTPPLPPCL